jgi:hypothetical protein
MVMGSPKRNLAKKKLASGMYATKARNLTQKQLKRSGSVKAAGKREQSVSTTSRATEGVNKGYTLGAGGKRFTGTVIMLNGDRAVYKGGKRVTNVKKPAVSNGSSSRSNSTPNPTPDPKNKTPSQKIAKQLSNMTPSQKAAAKSRYGTLRPSALSSTKNINGKAKPLITSTGQDSKKPRASYDSSGTLYHEMFFLGKWRRVRKSGDGKWYPI